LGFLTRIILKNSNRFVLILILGLLSAIGPFSIDMYLPGFPAIANSLHTSVDAVSYSLSSFFVGICIGQVLIGPLLDRFGRKKPLVIGLIVYLFASVGCALSTSIEMLIVFRLFQALGGCVSMVAPRAIVRDLFPVEENAKVLSLLILVLGVSPILAPTVGSFVIAHWGWSWVFVVLAVVTLLILMALILWLPESKQPDPTFSLRPKPILASFTTVIKDKQFFTYAFSGGIGSAGLFAYLSGSPFVFMKYYTVTEQEYGWIFALIAAGLISSSQLNNLLLRYYSSEQLMKWSLVVQVSVGILLYAGAVTGLWGLASTIFLMFLFLSCQGLIFPNSAALSMAPFTKEAGSASALMGAIQMGLGSLASAVIGLLNAQTPTPLAGVMASSATIGLIVLILGRRKMDRAATTRDIKEQTLDMIEKY
jgi:DHA1 family bicyclomycin/chloramphenicol resistance-like MFS transporter